MSGNCERTAGEQKFLNFVREISGYFKTLHKKVLIRGDDVKNFTPSLKIK